MVKKLEYSRENLRLLAFIIAKASSGSLFTKLLKDGGWTPESTASKEWQLAKKSKEEYLFEEFVKIAEQGRTDILDFVLEKVLEKDSIYFKRGEAGYKFPQPQFSALNRKLGKESIIPRKKNLKLFNERKLHPSVVFTSRRLFRDGYFTQGIFEACKLLNKQVQDYSRLTSDGKKLMLNALSVNNPLIKLNKMSNQSDKDEQEGFMHIFAGVMQGIRNPKGHELENLHDPIRALEYLGLISLLFRELDKAQKL